MLALRRHLYSCRRYIFLTSTIQFWIFHCTIQNLHSKERDMFLAQEICTCRKHPCSLFHIRRWATRAVIDPSQCTPKTTFCNFGMELLDTRILSHLFPLLLTLQQPRPINCGSHVLVPALDCFTWFTQSPPQSSSSLQAFKPWPTTPSRHYFPLLPSFSRFFPLPLNATPNRIWYKI